MSDKAPTTNSSKIIQALYASFYDPKLEQEYRLNTWRQMYWILVVGFSLGLIFEFLVMLIHLHQGIGEAKQPAALYTRISMLLTNSTLLLIVLKLGKSLRSLDIFNTACSIFILAKMIILMLVPRFDGVGAVNLIASLLFVYLLFLLPWLAKLALALVFSAGILISWLQIPNATPTIYYYFFWTVITNLVGAFVAYQRHITERISLFQQKQLEYNLHQKQQLLQRESTVTNLLSHELRTPLTTISLQSEALKKSATDKEQRIGKYIFGNTQALIKMIDNWLATNTNAEQSSQLSINVQAVTKQILHEVQISYPNTLIHHRVTPLDNLNHDERILSLALKGLLSNAAMHGASHKGLRISSYKSADHINFAIRDWGSGMSKEQLDTLFSRRSSKHDENAQPSLGVGLHLLKRLIKTSGGEIKAYSAEGVGTLMILSLPK